MIVRRSASLSAKPRMRLARGDAVLDDPVDRAADQLVGALRPEPRRDRHDAVAKPRLLPAPKRVEARAADRDLADMKRGHGRRQCRIEAGRINRLADQAGGDGKARGRARKPIESVIIVTNTDEATAGSAPARSSASGTITPASPAMTMLAIIAAAITARASGWRRPKRTPMPISTAMVTPLSNATRISRQIVRQVFDWVSWLVASARTVTASVWVPALPPTPATIGISAASATICAIVCSNRLMIDGGDQRGDQIGDQPAHPALVAVEHRLVDVALAGAGQQQDVLARFFLDDVDDVVDGDHADQPAGAGRPPRPRSARISGSGARLPPGPCRPGSASARASSRRRSRPRAACAGSRTACRCRPAGGAGRRRRFPRNRW